MNENEQKIDCVIPKVNENSLDNVAKVTALFPECRIAKGGIDFAKLRLLLGDDNATIGSERYELSWAGKTDAFRTLLEGNVQTLAPDREQSVNFDTTENIFIEGENLEVLKALQKSYFGKVKMIYIDPPYNTGSDSFIYPDRFSETKEEYLRRVGDKGEDGYMTREGLFRKNSKENGQYHSNWLSMMLPRLYLAKSLMCDAGVIFVSIDDNEVYNLRLLMNEVFGEENFVAQFIWEKRLNRENRNEVSIRHDYIVCYAKSAGDLSRRLAQLPMDEKALSNYGNPDNDPRGLWKSDPAHAQAGHGTKAQFYTLVAPNGKRHELPSGRCWLYTKTVMEQAIAGNRIWFGQDGNGVPRIKTYLNSKERGLTPETILFAKDVSTNEAAKNDLKELFDGVAVFDTPKPVELVKKLVQLVSKDGIVLDFFAGVGTTAHAVMQLNAEDGGKRRFICVQLPEVCDADSEAAKAGYQTIADISRERIRRAAKKIEEEVAAKQADAKNQLALGDVANATMPDLGFKVFRLQSSNFKEWRKIAGDDIGKLKEQMLSFVDPVSETATINNMAYELLLRSGKSLNSKIERRGKWFLVNNGELVLMLEEATQEIVNEVISVKPQKVVALDRVFSNNDQLKTNTALQLRDAGVEFKTI